MAVQSKHRFSVVDYHRMAEIGVLRPDARVELLDGEIIDMSPIGPFHGSIVSYLNEFFTQASKNRWLVITQNPLRLDDLSEPQPDLMLTRRSPDFYASRHPVREDVFLLIEVSDTTLDFDREKKLPAYGRAGVSEVWLVNLVERTVEVYREPNYTGYAAKTVLRAADEVRSEAFPDISISVAGLFQPGR